MITRILTALKDRRVFNDTMRPLDLQIAEASKEHRKVDHLLAAKTAALHHLLGQRG